MLYVEPAGFDLITAGMRFQTILVEMKLEASTDTKDSTFGIDEPPFTELELQHLLLSLVQFERIE
jgi:hypothetical protein